MTPANKSSAESTQWPAIGPILLIGGLTYFNTLGNGFVNFDDNDERLLKNPFLGIPWEWSFIAKAFTQATAGYYDPVYVLSYVVDYYMWGINPAGFHLGNLSLHLANSVFVFLILRRLTGKQPLALVSALLFAVHPIHVESVSWATSRKDTLSHFFALAAFWVYPMGTGRGAGRFAATSMLAVIFLMLGMMTKPTVVVLPVILLVSDLIFGPRPVPWKRILIFQSLTSLLLLLFVAWTLPMTLGAGVKPEIDLTAAMHFSLFLDLYGYFVKLIAFPLNLSAMYLITVNESFLRWGLWVLLMGLTGLVVWVVRGVLRAVAAPGTRGSDAVVWGTAVYLVSLFPFTNILPRTIYLADRYEYLASMGFCCVLAFFLLKIPRPMVKASAVVFMVFLYGALTIHRIPVWKSSSILWRDVDLKRNIPATRHHWIMGNAYAFEKEWDKALMEFEAAGLDRRGDPKQRLQMANIHLTVGNDGEARKITRKIIEDDPDYLPALSRLITIPLRSREYARAEKILLEFHDKFTPEEFSYLTELIRHDKTGDREQASIIYRKLTQLIENRMAHVQR